jgi:gamma-glutamyltranspeptidase/glutathione hydrolase
MTPLTRIRSSFAAVALLLGAATACHRTSAPAAMASASRASTQTFPATWDSHKRPTPTVGSHAMIASMSDLASEAGVEILKRGGNAVDAAVATGFALAVTYPSAGNIGGGGFMVIHMADGRNAAIDYREIAPLAATRNMYVDSAGKMTNKSLVGGLASGVPGAVAGMTLALSKYGTMSLHDVMQPAIRLAADGFVVDTALNHSLTSARRLISRFDGANVFYPNGQPLAIGTRFTQPALARTLSAIADQGPAAFYTGWVADSIVATEQHDGGIITRQDLAKYTAIAREPVTGTYRGYSLLAMPPSSSGGITMVEVLNQLETFGTLPPFGSTGYVHLLAETFRRAFVDRNEKLGDPAFVHVPMEQLTSKAYARTLAATIDPHHASTSPVFNGKEPMHTTHYSVADDKGNAVATTTTLNSSYGSGVYVGGAGFFMNNEMDDFASQPGTPNQFGLVQGEVNAIQPGKRMLSAMSPTIVLDPNGKVLLVVGAAGGPTIITATTEIILNVLDHHMSLADAMYAPRVHHQAWPDQLEYEAGGLSQPVIDSLTAMGHHLRSIRALATANGVMAVPGGWVGVSEPRGPAHAVGY